MYFPIISPSERNYLEQGVAKGVRVDGRGRLDYRHFTLETGLIVQTNGSARIRLGTTDILVGIKAELGKMDENTNEGKILCNVECCPSASSEFEGRGAEYLNAELARALERAFAVSTLLEKKKLVIENSEYCWTLYIDALVLDSGGNLFDALSIATRAAVFDTRIPKVKIHHGEKGDIEIDIEDDPSQFLQLDVSSMPLLVTLTHINGYEIVDATIDEEQCMLGRITVAVNKNGELCSILKGGVGGLPVKSIDQMMMASIPIGLEIIKKMDEILRQEKKSQLPKVGFFSS
eukprot:TRINITY_DN1726_c0_g2_i1.p1 TRINITY_DN1726_c0_g2~~TRINITY_DN1726_c0_g2_i1.p1  ORF type:complete len:310 (+),score=67.05 TRINITY_DN1726_c0_g2_i1:61-930(+)